MLLLGLDNPESTFSYVGRVIARIPTSVPALSKFLWKSEEYPILFFMQGQTTDLLWSSFKAALGYGSNWQPRGTAFRVDAARFFNSKYHSGENFAEKLLSPALKAFLQEETDAVTEMNTDLESLNEDQSLSPTARQALISARIGQGSFRKNVLSLFDNKCCVTGCNILEAIRASHIKPWRFSNNVERLDPANGLALTASLDALFDRHLITFSDSGELMLSSVINPENAHILQTSGGVTQTLTDAQRRYLKDHRAIFDHKEQLRMED